MPLGTVLINNWIVVLCMVSNLVSGKESDKSNVLIITHGRCTDGFCAAWVARKIFPDAHFHAAQFGESPPDVTGKEVFILDFSYKRPVLAALKYKAKSLKVIDHHKTAATELAGLPYCVFDMEKSGAGLTWHYFSHFTYPGNNRNFDGPMPWLVRYVQDRDLWRNELLETRAVNAVISSYPFDFDKWDDLACRDLQDVVEEGRSIVRYQDQIVHDLCSYAREVNFDGHKVLAVNTSIMNSDVGCKLAEGRPFGVVWFQRDDGKYVYSLRSSPTGIDVSQVASSHQGGGHRGCSGFVSDKQLV